MRRSSGEDVPRIITSMLRWGGGGHGGVPWEDDEMSRERGKLIPMDLKALTNNGLMLHMSCHQKDLLVDHLQNREPSKRNPWVQSRGYRECSP